MVKAESFSVSPAAKPQLKTGKRRSTPDAAYRDNIQIG
jgi:hypothetical protein